MKAFVVFLIFLWPIPGLSKFDCTRPNSIGVELNQQFDTLASALSVINDVCRAIAFGLSSGSTVSHLDFYHCHVLAPKHGEDAYADLEEIHREYYGLLCHTNELNGTTRFPNGRDNVNIFLLRNSKPSFVGIPRTAYVIHVQERFPGLLPRDAKHANQITFLDSNDSRCRHLLNRLTISCSQIPHQKFCLGTGPSEFIPLAPE